MKRLLLAATSLVLLAGSALANTPAKSDPAPLPKPVNLRLLGDKLGQWAPVQAGPG